MNAKLQHPFPERDFILIQPVFTNLVSALFKFLVMLASGLWIVRRWFRLKTLVGVLAASALMGLTVQAIVWIVLGLVNVLASEPVQLALLGVLALPTLYDFFRQPPRIRFRFSLPLLGAAALALVVLAILFLFGISKPIVEWDAMAIWGIKARVLFATETLRTLRSGVRIPNIRRWSPLPWRQWELEAKLQSRRSFPCLPCVCMAWCMRVWSGNHGRVGLSRSPFLCLPQIVEHTQNGYANLVQAVYVTLAVMLFAWWVYEQENSYAVATALVLAGLVLVRPDGEVYVGYIVLLALIVIWRKRLPKRTALIFSLPLLVDVLWKLFFVLYLRTQGVPRLASLRKGNNFYSIC